MTFLTDFRAPKPAPPREEEFDVSLSYGDVYLAARVKAKSHIEALDVAHALNREIFPDLPRLYRSGNATRVNGKSARQEAFE